MRRVLLKALTNQTALTESAHDSEDIVAYRHRPVGFGRANVLVAVAGFDPVHPHFEAGSDRESVSGSRYYVMDAQIRERLLCMFRPMAITESGVSRSRFWQCHSALHLARSSERRSIRLWRQSGGVELRNLTARRRREPRPLTMERAATGNRGARRTAQAQVGYISVNQYLIPHGCVRYETVRDVRHRA